MARYVPRFPRYSRFREWLTIPNTTTGNDHIAAINLPNGEQTVMETIESVHYPSEAVNTPRRKIERRGRLHEGPKHIAAREGTSDQIDGAIGGAILRRRNAHRDRHEPSRTSLPDVLAKRGRSSPRDRDSINIRRRGPALDLIIRFDRCR